MPETHSLRKLNTFGIDVSANCLERPDHVDELGGILENYNPGSKNLLILGEGSNILFTKDFDGLVLQPGFRGIHVIEEDKDQVLVKVGAAENWDNWVAYSLERGWYGLENLSLIPGSVGAAPVQNIGAYGVEFKDHGRRIHAWDLRERKPVDICHKNCHFTYRSSIFKGSVRGRYIITHVCFRLYRKPELKLGYGNIGKAFKKAGGTTASDLRNVIIQTRRSKLPDPDDFGNAGSFFKNPVIDAREFRNLHNRFPEIPYYPQKDELYKIPAAWLIEHTGWKGKRHGNVGTWPTQPLVIVNYGGASGKDILEFSHHIGEDVRGKFGINLEPEVNVM